MRALALVWGLIAATAIGQVGEIKEDAPPPSPMTSVLLQGAEGRIVVPINVLHDLAEAEPEIPAPEGAPREGNVLLVVTISNTGDVINVTKRVGDEALSDTAVNGVKAGWRYRPLMVNGEPQQFQSYISLQFHDGIGRRAIGAGQLPLPPGVVRVASGVMAGQSLRRDEPVYPPIARAAHVQGMVVLSAIISKAGDIENLQVISGPPMLVNAAKDAVQKWKYRPYLLNGEPTEVQTTVMVNFKFAEPPKPDVNAIP